MNKPYLSALPTDSQISSQLKNAYFHDSWSIVLGQPDLNVFQQLIKLFQHTPQWVEWSMNMRNKITSKIGLKDLGSFQQIDTHKKESEYVAGDRIGIFTFLQRTENELVIGDDDKHLNVTLSIYKNEKTQVLTVTTIVHIKNWLGRLYMLPVIPAHRKIVPATLQILG
ncbi:DUF2867 domain-containing protein [Acinetobacter pittii]|uniref:DUF2867 domain-containing protein n=1 Tax=Acinetobacter pittii TaxID=48296 RepID=A0A1C2U9N2_ACIPI|nr:MULTISPECIES: DUF2867 domain-containing protein [Acinetobacter]MDU6099457.1 DUF2867 domain-containing protein [Acinetobacter sp.]AMM27932.1 hypothetical protein AYJ52_05530 [Acinetobacter pittii]EXB00189.1 hypothetical protein J507_1090 [Acinetobacter sp. 1295259]KQE14937.1 hypothetical protein APD36_08100 [Acinetobacter pittii]KQF49591.1 hypothetical protein APC05_04920 [Acinetobacter pittii]